MSINDFVDRTIFLCLICFSIYDKMQGFIDESSFFVCVAGKTFFCEIMPVDCRYPVGQKFCRNRCISLHFQDKHVFAFYGEIQDGYQKWWENNFYEKLPVDSTNTLWVKTFVEIALSRSVSEINAFLHFQH